MPGYNHKEIEARWQRFWETSKIFTISDNETQKPNKYVLDMFPYPSAQGLHVGHPEGYTATDIIARYWRMNNYNVMHPMGWDAFGLPAEQYAIKTGVHPRATTEKNIENFRRQIKSLGFSYDWTREISTADPQYYKWTQWMFLLLFDTWYDPKLNRGRAISELTIPPDVESKGLDAVREFIDSKRLAYMTDVPVNWCEALGTVLSNEEVDACGKSVEGGHPVVKKPIRQWMLRITAYAERLQQDLMLLDWPENIKQMQREWIGLTYLTVSGVTSWNTRMHDWVFSRQRYWGEPIPILHGYDDKGQPTGEVIADSNLPVLLPSMSDFKPSGNAAPVLEKASEDWLWVFRDGKLYKRETNTMPQWAGSCWYYLRYLDPKNDKHFCDPAKQKQWLPVDLYVGGAEHAVLHLLYARFWHKVLFDRGFTHDPEPFQKLANQGMILGKVEFTAYKKNGMWIDLKNVDGTCEEVSVSDDEVVKKGNVWVLKDNESVQCNSRSYKMAKSRGNVVNPDEIVEEFGADTLRLYEMFLGPLEASKPWDTKGIAGCSRFLHRVWRTIINEGATEILLSDSVADIAAEEDVLRHTHRTVHRVRGHIEALRFNSAIAALMEFTNYLTKLPAIPKEAAEKLVLMLAPFAPHMAEELWKALGHIHSLAFAEFPKYDPALIVKNEVEIPVQVNGKVVAKLQMKPPVEETTMHAEAMKAVQAIVEKEKIRRVIVVPGKIVNVVTH